MKKEENTSRRSVWNIRISDLFRISCFGFLISAACVLVGCETTNGPSTQPSSVSDRQNNALNDPFGYTTDKDPADISGGGINQYDRNAMKKDLDHVLNP